MDKFGRRAWTKATASVQLHPRPLEAFRRALGKMSTGQVGLVLGDKITDCLRTKNSPGHSFLQI
jgi:hypothetical protein